MQHYLVQLPFPHFSLVFTPKTVFFLCHFLALKGLHSCVYDFLPLFISYTCAFLFGRKEGADRKFQKHTKKCRAAGGQNQTGNLDLYRAPGSYGPPPNHTAPPPGIIRGPPRIIRGPPRIPPESYGNPP